MVGMPAPGDNMKVGMDEVRKPGLTYVLGIPTAANKFQEVKSATKENDGVKT